jgi:hypothetical protein
MPRRPELTIRKRWHDLICLALLLLVWLAVWVPRLHGPIDLRWDASTYYVLGTSLAEGKGYRLLNEPGEIAAVQYPPLLPMIVAAHERILGTNDFVKVGSALRFSYFFLSGFYLLSVYALARRLLSPLYALLVGVITALSFYSFLHPSDTLYAELPFALVSMLFLLCQHHGDRPLNAIASGFLGVFAYLLRTAGLALLAAWIAQSLIRRRFREAAIRLIVSAIPLLLWQAYIWRVTNSYEYLHPAYSYQRAPYYYSNVTYGENSRLVNPFRPELGRTALGDLPRRVARNLAAVPISLGESALVDSRFGIPGHERKSSRVLYICLIAAGLSALAGAAIVAFGRHWLLSLYFTFMVGLIVLTPWKEQFWRYFAPIAPLTLIFITLALLTTRHWLTCRGPKWARATGAVVTPLAFAGVLVIQLAVAVYFLRTLLPVSYYDASGREQTLHLLTYGAPCHSLDSAFEWVRRHAAASAVIATAVPHMAYIRSGHKAVLAPLERDPAKASRLLEEIPVDYLVLDQLGAPFISEHYAAPVVAQRPDQWRLLYTAPDGGAKVYERLR